MIHLRWYYWRVVFPMSVTVIIDQCIVLNQFSTFALLKFRNDCGIKNLKEFGAQIWQCFCDQNIHSAVLTSRIQEIAVKVSGILIPTSIVLYVTSTTIFVWTERRNTSMTWKCSKKNETTASEALQLLRAWKPPLDTNKQWCSGKKCVGGTLKESNLER